MRKTRKKKRNTSIEQGYLVFRLSWLRRDLEPSTSVVSAGLGLVPSTSRLAGLGSFCVRCTAASLLLGLVWKIAENPKCIFSGSHAPAATCTPDAAPGHVLFCVCSVFLVGLRPAHSCLFGEMKRFYFVDGAS